MYKVIQEKLMEIEEKENVRILHAVESGSRAWGFASPDSDYDVRFIYVRPMEFYLKLEKTRDVIEWQLDDTLDINGWDLQKMLRLLHSSNPTIFEWNHSPLVYKTTEDWLKIRRIINGYFQSVPGLYHYLNMAQGNYREYLRRDMVRLKKYFYVLRPILACRWILAHGTPPPMQFAELYNSMLEDTVKPEVDRLLDLKINAPEITEGPRVDALNAYIERNFKEITEQLSTMERSHTAGYDVLNHVFLEAIGYTISNEKG